jgi:hypothetical protein
MFAYLRGKYSSPSMNIFPRFRKAKVLAVPQPTPNVLFDFYCLSITTLLVYRIVLDLLALFVGSERKVMELTEPVLRWDKWKTLGRILNTFHKRES